MSKQARPLSVLLVEDSPSDVVLVQAQLVKSGLNISFKSVDRLDAALQRLKWKRFDVVLLDLTLPDSQGIATFQAIHAAANDTPVIVLSGEEDRELAVQAVREGAQDYLSKQKADSDALIRSIRYAVERARRQRAEAQLSAAGALQQRLFPRTAPSIPGFDISARYKPAIYAGGTLLDLFSIDRNHLGIVIAEADGSGVGRSITMAETRSVIHAFATVTSDVGEILTRASEILAKDLSEEASVALFLASIHVPERTLQFASAGLAGHVLNAVGRPKRSLESPDPPLGAASRESYTTSREVPLEDNDSLLLCTSSLTEASERGGARFGLNRVLDAVQAKYEENAQHMLDHVFEEVKSFLGDAAQEHDITSLLLKSLPAAATKTAPRVDVPVAVQADARSGVAHLEYNSFDVDKQGDVAVLRFRDREILSTEKCDEMRDELVGFINQDKPSRLVISFQEVEKFSSEGIKLCFHAKKALDAQNSHLRLCELRPQLLKSFKALDRRGRVFSIHRDLGKALSSF